MAQRPDIDVDAVLNTDSGLLRDLVCRTYPRSSTSTGRCALRRHRAQNGGVPAQPAGEEEKRGIQYDYLLDLDITSPLRTKADILGCVALKEQRPDRDVVMSAAPSRRSPYMNMAKRVDDHVEQVVRTNFTARQQTPPCYDLNASIYVFRRDFLAENQTGFLWDGRCEVYEMRDTGVLDIDSEEDFQLMEVIGGYLYRSDEGFAEVKREYPVAACSPCSRWPAQK